MVLKFVSLCAFIMTFSFSSVVINNDEMLIKTKSGFETYADIYYPDTKVTKNNKVFIVLHGKGSYPKANHLTPLYDDLEDKGYKVITPRMPWSKEWNGTFSQGLEVLDEIITSVHKNGNNAILVGHSLGGASSLIYSTEERVHGLLGVVVIAPGHMIHRSKKIFKITKQSVEKARKEVESGNSKEELSLEEMNTGKVSTVLMRADVYLSFYDRKEFPNIDIYLEDITYPILWLAGKKDRLTKVYKMKRTFHNIPNSGDNEFVLLKAGHKNIVKKSADTILDWINKL